MTVRWPLLLLAAALSLAGCTYKPKEFPGPSASDPIWRLNGDLFSSTSNVLIEPPPPVGPAR